MADVAKREKENFLRIAVLLVDHSKAALISLIELDLKLKGVSFDQFLNNNQHAIFHMCFPKRCCQCVGKRNTSYSKVLYPPQMELLFDKTRKLHSNHVNAVGANDFCCSAAKPSVTLDSLDMTLARFFLVNFCFDVFWDFNLRYKKQSLEDFLNAEKHTIYHLWQNSTSCCHCPPVFSSTMNYPKLDQTEWQSIFPVVSPQPPCSVLAGVAPCNSLCMYQASPAITPSSLNPQLQQKILEHCCHLRQIVETVVKIRNERFGHAKDARLSDSEFQAIKSDLEQAIIDIAVFCNTEPAVRKAIHSTLTESLDHILSAKHKELIGQFCQDISQHKEQLEELDIRMKKTDEGLSEATSELEQLSNSLIQTTTRVDNMEEITLTLKEQVTTERERVDSKLEKTDKAVAEIEDTIEVALAVVEETKAKVDDSNAGIEEIKDEVTITKSGMETIYSRIDAANKELNKASTRLDQIEKDQREILEDPVPPNIRENIDKELNEWEDDAETFVPTRASEEIVKILKTHNCVTITASSGVGKTANLRRIALMMKKAGYDVLPITDPRDVGQFYKQNRKTLFVIDDFCGRYSINHTDFEKWKTYIQFGTVDKIIDKDKSVKFLVACRLQVYQDELFKSLSVFQRYECNLLSNEFCLSNNEKVAIANYYLKEESHKVLSHLNTHYCFALLCKMYSLNPTLKINDFFEKPYTVYESEIDKLYSEGHYGKYCVLAMCVMFNNQLKEEWLTEDIDDIGNDIKNIIEKTCEACKLNRGTSRLQLLDELSSLKHMFVKKEHGVFKALHDRIFDFLSFYFGKKMLKSLIKNAKSGLIRERFLLENTDNETNIEFVTVIPSFFRDMYLGKMISDWSKGNIVDVFSNINMKSKNFRELFFSFLLQRDPLEQKQLATKRDYQNGASVMLQCCFNGDINILKWCMENNGDVNICTVDDESPLFVACEAGHLEIVEILLHNNADMNKCIHTGASPLLVACDEGHTEIVKRLLHNKADINKCLDDGASSLFIASQNGHLEIVKTLLHNKADINKCMDGGVSPLLIASQSGRTEIVKFLLYNKANINKCDKKGASPLYIASNNGHTDIVKLLLHNKADINKCDDDGESPLFVACDEGHAEIVKTLLHNKADINKCTDEEASPLFIASMNGHTEIVKILLHNKADINKCTDEEVSPLFMASQNGHLEIVKTLLHNKTDINKCTDDGASPLFIACGNGHTEIVEILLHNKADINKCMNSIASPLYIASKNGHTGIVKLLLHNKADVNKCMDNGESPLCVACEEGHAEIVKILLENNADVSMQTNQGESPFDIAFENGHLEIMEIL